MIVVIDVVVVEMEGGVAKHLFNFFTTLKKISY